MNNIKLYIASKVSKKSKVDILTYGIEWTEEMESILQQYQKGKPLSKIFKTKCFWNWEFETSEDTLDPRPETELIIELILKNHFKKEKLHFVDLGTGTGAIIISLLRLFPNSSGIAIDISDKAIQIAKKNSEKLGVSSRLTFKKNNWLNDIESFCPRGSILLSNPPYLSKEEIEMHRELKYDPYEALYAANVMEKYEPILSKKDFFKEIYLEIHPNIFNKFPGFNLVKDYSNRYRIVWIKN